jgi:hypothetical protein
VRVMGRCGKWYAGLTCPLAGRAKPILQACGWRYGELAANIPRPAKGGTRGGCEQIELEEGGWNSASCFTRRKKVKEGYKEKAISREAAKILNWSVSEAFFVASWLCVRIFHAEARRRGEFETFQSFPLRKINSTVH